MHCEDAGYIRLALKLAEKAKGRTSPNPCVGAVVVKDGKIVGKGYHRRYGGPHAEIYALRQAGSRAKGAVLYVSLEPCSHYGKTPPCVDSIISSGIGRVVAAMKDPNPLNDGNGLKQLRKKGIRTDVGIMEDEARRLNEAFIKYITVKTPFVTVKAAESLDGKIATRLGESRWITSSAAREYVHRLRYETDAVLTGINTILKDDPSLNARVKGKISAKQPLRIILDDRLRIPLNAKVLKSQGGKVIIAVLKAAPREKIERLKAEGAEILTIKAKNQRVGIKDLLRKLADRGVADVLIEGGSEVIASAFEAGVVDRAIFFIAPKIIGGRQALGSVGGRGAGKITDTIELRDVEVERIGRDILVKGRVKK